MFDRKEFNWGVLAEVMQNQADREFRCNSCGGVPLDGGAMLSLVVFVKDAKIQIGAVCESCHLRVLQRRALKSNTLSDQNSQFAIPELDIFEDTNKTKNRFIPNRFPLPTKPVRKGKRDIWKHRPVSGGWVSCSKCGASSDVPSGASYVGPIYCASCRTKMCQPKAP